MFHILEKLCYTGKESEGKQKISEVNMGDTAVTDSYRVLLSGGEGEIVEKKSRFIATIRKCETEEEAVAFIEEMKKKYWDARHNCSAFIIGSRGELTRCSDDGEPSGTAGRPMLEVLTGSGIRNIAVVVTRYFGGTLLGTGGLVRAYTQAVKEGLAHCETGIMKKGCRLEIVTDYNDVGKLQYSFGQNGIVPSDSIYAENVKFILLIPVEKEENLSKNLIETTCGKVKIEKTGEMYFIDKET